MKQKYLLLLLATFCFKIVVAQNSIEKAKGFILDHETGLSVENVHIINLQTQKGTISTKIGYFELVASANDSLIISCISYLNDTITASSLIRNKNLVHIKRTSLEIDEIVLKPQSWQQFKLEFVQKKWDKERSTEVTLIGVQQYKGPLKPYKPSLVNVITSPISFTHHLLNKKSRQRRKTKRYKRILSKSYLIED